MALPLEPALIGCLKKLRLCLALSLRVEGLLERYLRESHGNKEENDLRRGDAKAQDADCVLALPAHA